MHEKDTQLYMRLLGIVSLSLLGHGEKVKLGSIST